MKYRSTRGGVEGVSFVDAVMMGLAPDRGLLVPERIPSVSKETLASWRKLNFPALAFEIISLYVDRSEISADELRGLVTDAYATFRADAVTPVVPLATQARQNDDDREAGGDGDQSRLDVYLLELFHGPTFAFKDVALQFLGRLFELILSKKNKSTVEKSADETNGDDDERSTLTILGATSGDTGSSAIEGVRGRARVECFILYPEGRTSRIQEAQMATVPDPNVHAVAVRGAEFDDCQRIVKTLFADATFRKKHALGAVNSINWARIVAQITYYFYAAFRVAEMTNASVQENLPWFSVPTGNFGDVLAGWYAKMMGCPCAGLVVATNTNDILRRFFDDGSYARPSDGATPTLAPSMDICVSSNFERFLYHCAGDDAVQCAALMRDFESQGRFDAPDALLRTARSHMRAASVDERGILDTINQWHEKSGYVLDPHTAVGVKAGIDQVSKVLFSRNTTTEEQRQTPLVCLACAHHAKFPEAVAKAIGETALAAVPPEPALASLLDKPKRNAVVDNDIDAVAAFIDSQLRLRVSSD